MAGGGATKECKELLSERGGGGGGMTKECKELWSERGGGGGGMNGMNGYRVLKDAHGESKSRDRGSG